MTKSIISKYQFIIIADTALSRNLYNNIFENDTLTLINEYSEVEDICSHKTPVVVDPVFRQFCPKCKGLMPPGKPPMKCHCGENVRLGYIPLYNLPKIKFGYVFASSELPKKPIQALRAKGWRVVKVKDTINVFNLRDYVVEYLRNKDELRGIRNVRVKQTAGTEETQNKSGNTS